MSPVSWGDIFTLPLGGDRIMELRQSETTDCSTLRFTLILASSISSVVTTTRYPHRTYGGCFGKHPGSSALWRRRVCGKPRTPVPVHLAFRYVWVHEG